MLKKAMPLVLMSGLVLGACGMNNTVPKNNETPMEKVEDRTRDLTPKVRDTQRSGTNLDGIDNGRDVNNGNGVINEGNTNVPNETIINDGTTTTPNETIIENANPNNPNETIIEDNLNTNRTNR